MGTSQTSFSPAGTLLGTLHPSLECIQPLPEKGFKLDWWSATEPTSTHTLSDTRTLSSLNDFKALRESVTHHASSDSLENRVSFTFRNFRAGRSQRVDEGQLHNKFAPPEKVQVSKSSEPGSP